MLGRRADQGGHLRRSEVATCREAGKVDALRRSVQGRRQRLRRFGTVHRAQIGQALRPRPPAHRREHVDHGAAADGAAPRLVAHDHGVAVAGGDRAVKHQLRETTLARRQRAALEQRDAPADIGGADVRVHRGPVREGARFRGQDAQAHVDALRRRRHARAGDDVTARDTAGGDRRAGEVERTALACLRARRRTVLRVQPAHACIHTRQQGAHLVAYGYFARQHSAGDHQAGAGQGEGAVHRHAEITRRRPRATAARAQQKFVAQRRDALAGK